MKINDINEEIIRTISDKELLNLHYRLHQQYILAKKRDDSRMIGLIKSKHKIVVAEMIRRIKNHKSPMLVKALKKMFD